MKGLWRTDRTAATKLFGEFEASCEEKAASRQVDGCSCMLADPRTYLCRDVFQYLDLEAPITKLQLKTDPKRNATVFYRYVLMLLLIYLCFCLKQIE